MDVILDANILRSDLPLNSSDIEVLLDYLKRTESSIILPKVAYDEAINLYNKTIETKKAALEKHLASLNGLLFETNNLELPTIDLALQIEKYEERIKKKLLLKERSFLKNDKNLLDEIVKRQIRRIKPAGLDGQGFRDTLIWLSIKEYCKSTLESQIAFISLNHNDFGYKDKPGLHSDLKKECEDEDIKINYFKTIREFVENHSVQIDHISLDWLVDNLDFKWAEGEILDAINGKFEEYFFRTLSDSDGSDFTGQHQIDWLEITDVELYGIYEMIDGEIVLSIDLKGSLSVEAEIVVYDHEFGYGYPHSTDTIDTQMSFVANASLKLLNDEIHELLVDDLWSKPSLSF